MEWISALATIGKGYATIHKKLELDSQLDSIRQELAQVYSDLAGADFKAAQASIRAAHQSRQPQHELRSAVTHLRSGYYTYRELLTKTRIVTTMFVFESEEPFLDNNAKLRVHKELCRVATFLAIIYAGFGEITNAVEWEAAANEHFEVALETVFFFMDNEDLRRVKSNYVIVRSESWTDRWYNQHYREWLEITPAGEMYVDSETRKLQKKAKAEFAEIFDSLGIR